MLLSKNSSAFSDEISAYMKSQYEDFQKYQELATKTLQEVHRICEKNNITYYLAFGSLLGAIRDGGQIPWDYDIDILVPFRFREQLISALKRDLSPDYHFETKYTDKKCRHYTVRVAPKQYDCGTLHVDIFWLIGEASDPKVQKMHYKIRHLFFKCSLFRHPNRRDKKMYNRVTRLKRIIKFRQYYFLPEHLLEQQYLKLLEIPLETSEYCTYNGRFRYLFKSKWFGTPQKYTTVDGLEFYIPEDYESILRSSYGDYMKVPGIEKRVHEFQHTLELLNKYARLDE